MGKNSFDSIHNSFENLNTADMVAEECGFRNDGVVEELEQNIIYRFTLTDRYASSNMIERSVKKIKRLPQVISVIPATNRKLNKDS